MTSNPLFSEPTVRAMSACIEHAQDLIDAAKAVTGIGKHHIAYHLAALALEELGRREIIGIQATAADEPIPPSWLQNHSQKHVQKLFWCFFGSPSFYQALTKKGLEDMQLLARTIHDKRQDGLYVDHSEAGLQIPKDALSPDDATQLISFAEVRLDLAKAPMQEVAPEHQEEQRWLLQASADPEKRKLILSGGSLKKLGELKDVRAWVTWMRDEFAKAENEAHALVTAELERSKNLPRQRSKDKWRMRIRIFSDSHSIRPGTLKKWNDASGWIKLIPVSGKKKQLFIEFTLGDNVPAEALWFYGWGIARHLVVALNIGTMGFWWWHLPEQISKYYETLHDLERDQQINIERAPSLKLDWGQNRVLTEEEIGRVAAAFAALPTMSEREKHNPFNFYIGGVTFLSLNDVHWQCELEAFGNFYESLKAMMKDGGEWDGQNPFGPHVLQFVSEFSPEFDRRERFHEIFSSFDRGTPRSSKVTLEETTYMKLFCDAYFLRKVMPPALVALKDGAPETTETVQMGVEPRFPQDSGTA